MEDESAMGVHSKDDMDIEPTQSWLARKIIIFLRQLK